jgi:hypothetical protein
MNVEIQALQAKVLQRLSVAATEGQIDEVTRLSAMAAKTKELQTAAQRIQSELTEMQRAMAERTPTAPPPPTISDAELENIFKGFADRRSPNSTIQVTIDWSKNGQPFGVETISEHLGSATIAKVMERLTHILGQRVLEVASNIRVKRGPMISKDPARDYWNATGNRQYQYRPINGTGFSVLTGTESGQKVDDVTTLLKKLALVPGSYSVKKVMR